MDTNTDNLNKDDGLKLKELDSELEFKLETRKWQNRKKMAYVSLYTLIAIDIFTFTIALFSTTGSENLAKIDGVIITLIATLGSLCGAYMGLSTWSDISKINVNKDK